MYSAEIGNIILSVFAVILAGIGTMESSKYLIRCFKQRYLRKPQTPTDDDVEAIAMISRPEREYQPQLLGRSQTVQVYIIGHTFGVPGMGEVE
ncbi:hypothetical protein FPQ18DRAFT_404280 [Pyronema domesticum]|nr:hypothetical protein FPQ18DRAFT_404280 [Pyronema domesticum]